METDGGGTLLNKEAIQEKSANAEEGGKDEVKEETGVSPSRCDGKEEGEKDEVDEETGVSPARWWVLAIFSLLGMVQCMLWNTWGPVRTLVL